MSGIQFKDGKIEYRCGECGQEGVKLWRDPNTFLDYQHLYCASCCLQFDVDEEGMYEDPFYGRTCQLKNSRGEGVVPAVLTESETTFYGYTSGTQEAVEKWTKLPTYNKEKLPTTEKRRIS